MFLLLELMEDETIARAVAFCALWHFCAPVIEHAALSSPAALFLARLFG
ncbi:MAG: hypothetical protein KGI37_08995 [Alphaproteobacteria bacterium]|nr:hypothetical protein [Alphaproteobacteria bacterium]